MSRNEAIYACGWFLFHHDFSVLNRLANLLHLEPVPRLPQLFAKWQTSVDAKHDVVVRAVIIFYGVVQTLRT
jgi:hypothetical protein